MTHHTLLFKILCVALLVSTFLGFSRGDVLLAQDAEDTSLEDDTHKISMDFDNTPVKEVLKIFSQQSGLNFITNKDVESKTVTVYFENVSVKDALNSIIQANNLGYSKEEGSNIYIVYSLDSTTPPLETRVFHLKYTRLSVSPIDVAGQRTVTDLLTSDIPTISNAATPTSSGSSATPTTLGTTQQTPNQKSSINKGIDQLVASLLSSQGKLTVDIHSNSIIVTDTPEKLRAIEEIIKKVDVPTPQVILEVYVMEVKKDVVDNLGVEWGGSNGALFDFAGATRSTSLPFSSGLFKKRLRLDAPISPESITVGAMGGSNLAAELHMIKDDKDTKILAQPRVLTLNNEAATIQLVTNQGIAITNITVTTGAAPVTTATVERAQLGVSLKMTPQIDDDDSIQLFLEPAVSTAVRNTQLGATFNILDPTTRIVRTIARVRNEQTLVIGGLVDTNRFSERRKIPVLGDIPVMGKAFAYDQRNDSDREILIFVTPYIVRTPESPTPKSFYKDIAVKKMLDSFEDIEMDKVIRTAEQMSAKDAASSVSALQTRIVSPKDLKSNPLAEQEMNQALNSFDPKSPKLNR